MKPQTRKSKKPRHEATSQTRSDEVPADPAGVGLRIAPGSDEGAGPRVLDDSVSVEDRVAQRAYELYQARGCCIGHDLDDWFQAEREVLGRLEAPDRERAEGNQP